MFDFDICANKCHNVLVLALKTCDVSAFSEVSVSVDLFFIETLKNNNASLSSARRHEGPVSPVIAARHYQIARADVM